MWDKKKKEGLVLANVVRDGWKEKIGSGPHKGTNPYFLGLRCHWLRDCLWKLSLKSDKQR